MPHHYSNVDSRDRETSAVLRMTGQNGVDYFIHVDPDRYERYHLDGEAIPLVSVVERFDVWRFRDMQTPSRGELEDAFGTTNMDEIMQTMVDKGTHQGCR